MAKAIEMSVQKYADSVGVSRGTIYRWAQSRLKDKPSKLPKNVKVKMVADHFVLEVKQ